LVGLEVSLEGEHAGQPDHLLKIVGPAAGPW
jgi:hypothetical protein